MTRITVLAEKDPRVAPAPRAALNDWANAVPGLTPAEAETLLAVAMTLCPHLWLDLAYYKDAVVGMMTVCAAHDHERATLKAGLKQLDGSFPAPFVDLSDGNRTHALKTVEGSSFFRLCLTRVTRHLYDLPEVWAGCGYEGACGAKDGVIRTDIDDEAANDHV